MNLSNFKKIIAIISSFLKTFDFDFFVTAPRAQGPPSRCDNKLLHSFRVIECLSVFFYPD